VIGRLPANLSLILYYGPVLVDEGETGNGLIIPHVMEGCIAGLMGEEGNQGEEGTSNRGNLEITWGWRCQGHPLRRNACVIA
jgi:hypothetical protein